MTYKQKLYHFRRRRASVRAMRARKMTLAEIGKKLKITRQRVHAILKSAA